MSGLQWNEQSVGQKASNLLFSCCLYLLLNPSVATLAGKILGVGDAGCGHMCRCMKLVERSFVDNPRVSSKRGITKTLQRTRVSLKKQLRTVIPVVPKGAPLSRACHDSVRIHLSEPYSTVKTKK
jgi:hypothetical protein